MEEPRTPVRAVRDGETAASILPGAARVGELDALLREVDGLRLTLETDLSLVAAAVEAGHPDIAVSMVDSGRESLHAFESTALEHLAQLADAQARPGSRWARFATASFAAPFAAAATIVALLVGVIPSGPNDVSTSAVSAQSSLDKLEHLAAQGETSQVRSTSRTLHAQINALVADSQDPQAAAQALLLLSYERLAIVQSGDEDALRDVLAAGHAIAIRIRSRLPGEVRTLVPKVPSVVAPTPAPAKASPQSSSRPKQTSSATPSPSPSPTRSATAKPKPTSSPTPSASPSATPTAGDSGNSNPYPIPLG